MNKKRLDLVLLNRNMVESRSSAQRLISAGNVLVDGVLLMKPAQLISQNAIIELIHPQKFVSRGGEKLDFALGKFNLLNLSGKICADVGASTGGFTDCLLAHNALKIYAIDVGHGILHPTISNDHRVVVMEQTNARYVQQLPELVDLITVDVSFISLKVLLPVLKGWLREEGQILVLIKPQFEAGRKNVAKGSGVIRDQHIHREVIKSVVKFAGEMGFNFKNLCQSPITGPKGNVEFLVLMELNGGELQNKCVFEEALFSLFGTEELNQTT